MRTESIGGRGNPPDVKNRIAPARRAAVIAALRDSGLVSIDAADEDDTSGAGVNIDDPRCVSCGIAFSFPGVSFDQAQVCSACRRYARDRDRIAAWFRATSDLAALLAPQVSAKRDYDCLLLFSGGKDSTFALYRLVEMGLSVATFTLDNGFISPGALKNVERVTAQLGVHALTLRPEGIDETIKDSLTRLATPCTGCFRSLLVHAVAHAESLAIPFVVTGLSRGQIVQERLEWFHQRNIYEPAAIEAALARARRAYHWAPSFAGLTPWDTTRDDLLDRVQVIDFYRYVAASEREILECLVTHDDTWTRPNECGFCSTNCMINDPGIALHQKENGWHSYEASNAWEVRLGHKPREAAVVELERVSPAAANPVLESIGLPPIPIQPLAREGIICRIAPGTTLGDVVSHLDGCIPDWAADFRIVYRDGIVAAPPARGRVRVAAPAAVRASIEEEARWRALAGRASARRVREHVLLALPAELGARRARREVVAALAVTHVFKLGFVCNDQEVAVRPHGLGASALVQGVDFRTVDEGQHLELVRRLIARQVADAPADGPALRAVLIDRGTAAPWLLLCGTALQLTWSDWRALVRAIGDSAARYSGPAADSRRPALAGMATRPVAPDPLDPPPLALPTRVVTLRIGQAAEGADECKVAELLAGDDRSLQPSSGGGGAGAGIGLRRVGRGEGCLPGSAGATVLIDPRGRWLSDHARIQIVAEPAGAGWLAHVHHHVDDVQRVAQLGEADWLRRLLLTCSGPKT